MVPRRAPVRPRVQSIGDSAILPLEHHIRQLLDEKSLEPVNIFGPPGCGKSAALGHIAALFGDRVHVVDGSWSGGLGAQQQQQAAIESRRLIVFATGSPASPRAFALAPWTRDDVIEYLLAAYPTECKSVMARLGEQGDELQGSPEFWVIVLEAFAADRALDTVSDALRRHAAAELGDSTFYQEVACYALQNVCRGSWSALPRDRYSPKRTRLFNSFAVSLYLASDALCASLAAQESWALASSLPPDLLTAAAPMLRQMPEAVESLKRALRLPYVQSAGSSLLIRADPAWRPEEPLSDLQHAQLQNAKWKGVNLAKCNLRRAAFVTADLSDARLTGTNAYGANFTQAWFCRALMDAFIGVEANFTMANLIGARGDDALFNHAIFKDASARMAWLRGAQFTDADLAGCDLSMATVTGSHLCRTNLAGADFTCAMLNGAQIAHCSFRNVTLNRTSFEDAVLVGCDFEGVEFAGAKFRNARLPGCLFTGSTMHGADFSGASLRRTGLAEIDWQGADLRCADLREASFHMGSSRSGLVHSDIASEGTRTGFYTDDYNDQDFKTPEEIRKANLGGCDLRGANIEHTDFYLVDLRGARYTDDQREHFARCGAILRSRA